MKVYVVMNHVSYEGSDFRGAFSSLEKAQEHVKSMMQPPNEWTSQWRWDCGDDVDIIEIPLDVGIGREALWHADWSGIATTHPCKLPNEHG